MADRLMFFGRTMERYTLAPVALEDCGLSGRQGAGAATRTPAGRATETFADAASMGAAPFVSVVIPVRNERRFIACCLDSVLANDYPRGQFEILVVDGGSDDGTRAIVDSYASRFAGVRVFDNPDQATPQGLNRGIRQARGGVIARVDAHARLAPDYLSQCVRWLTTSGADNVGGAMRTLPQDGGVIARAIALALGHRFGVGGSAFRTAAGEPRWVDTVFGGCYRREVFERVGWFNERLSRGQDMEFNLRLKRAGGRTLLVPAIRCDYFARSSMAAFVRHNWTNGVWAVRPFLESEIVPVRPRHLAPLAFVVALGAAVAGWFLPLAFGGLTPLVGAALVAEILGVPVAAGPWPLLMLVSCYLAAALAASAQLGRRGRDTRAAALLPVVFLALHLSYGLGSFWELARVAPTIARRRWGFPRRIRKT